MARDIFKRDSTLLTTASTFKGMPPSGTILPKTEKREKELPKALNLQLAFLRMVCDEYSIPILLTNQVTPFKEGQGSALRPIAGSSIRKYADNEVALIHINRKLWKATHKNEEEYYMITDRGIKVITG